MKQPLASQRTHMVSSRDALRAGVRRSLRVSTGLLVACIAPIVAADSFPAVVPLANLCRGDGSEGVVLHKEPPRGAFAYNASMIGDVNGDGLADVAVVGTGGATYVVFGTASGFPPIFELKDLLPTEGGDGRDGFVLQQQPHGSRPPAVSGAGDVNGDGIDDVIVGFGYLGDQEAGRSYVVFGRYTAQRGNFPPVFPLYLLRPPAGDGSLGFAIEGAGDCDTAGKSVSAAGDVNGDGIDDLVIGAPGRNEYSCYLRAPYGRSYVVFGRDTPRDGDFPAAFELASLQPEDGGDGSTGFILEGIEANDNNGRVVSSAGDVNGDGLADLLLSASLAPRGLYKGQAYVVFGRDTANAGNFPAEMSLATLLPIRGGDGSAGFVMTGASPYSHTGESLSAAGDINGDGVDDILIGAEADTIYVLFGRDTAHEAPFPPNFPLRLLSPENGGTGRAGFVIASDGDSVSRAGDLNGDGIADLITGAPYATVGLRGSAGESFVLFGRNTAQVGNFPPVFPTRLLFPPVGDGHAGFVVTGFQLRGRAGTTVGGGGDVNGDGVGDVVVSMINGAAIVFGRASGQ